MSTPRLLILGIGNLLMGDEGIGVHVARELARRRLPAGVVVVDGGTGGFHLLEYFSDYDPLIMIDATMDGKPPGALALIEPKYASDFPRSLTAHDIGLRDLVESAAMLGTMPKIYLVTASVAELQPMQTTLSEPLAAAVSRAADFVENLAAWILGAAPGANGTMPRPV